jgi:DnaK suppressor protein
MKSDRNKRRSLLPEELEKIKARLLERKKELWDEILEDLEQDAREEHKELIQTIREEGDIALAELRESTIFSLIELKHRELEAIESALQRIEEGKYGHCQECGRFIRPARLEIMPHAVRCRECQERIEKLERAAAHGGQT